MAKEVSRRDFLFKYFFPGGAAVALSALGLNTVFDGISTQGVVDFLAHSGIYTPVSPEEVTAFYRLAEPMKQHGLVHATVYPVNSIMLRTISKSFPLLSRKYENNSCWSFNECTDLANQSNTWSVNKDGFWADGICLVSTVTARALEFARNEGFVSELTYHPHPTHGYPAAKMRLTNQHMVNAKGYDYLGNIDAGVYYLGSNDSVDMNWTVNYPFRLELKLWDNTGRLIERFTEVDTSMITNEQIASLPRQIYFLTSQVHRAS